jgi:peptidoglycan/LPS O-acetylase OafA/YrhL
LRAVSITIVLVSHAGFGTVVPGGLGVTIFFFLSGYLITTLLLDEYERSGRIDIGKFYLCRVFRLFPPLVVTLIIAYALVILGLLDGNFSGQASSLNSCTSQTTTACSSIPETRRQQAREFSGRRRRALLLELPCCWWACLHFDFQGSGLS